VSPDIIRPAQASDQTCDPGRRRIQQHAPLRTEARFCVAASINDSLTDDQSTRSGDRAKAEKAASLREEDLSDGYAIDILKGLSALGPEKVNVASKAME